MRTGILRYTIVAAVVALMVGVAPAQAYDASQVRLTEYKIPKANMAELRALYFQQLRRRADDKGWAELRFNLGDRALRLMGLPSKKFLLGRRYKNPTLVYRTGQKGGPKGGGGNGGSGSGSGGSAPVTLPTLATFAGTGWFGIRPGAWILLIEGNSIGWCSAAHVFGTPGNYDISTAGHCGKPGTVATVIAGFGNRGGLAGPVLLDFGTFGTSHDGGLGNDWALIDIFSQYQSLVTPTMAFWGGPRGVFTKTGSVASVTSSGRFPFISGVSVNPDPFLAQQIVHYGHGIGVGAGGTPRSGTAVSWGASHFMFFGAISPGDSGSGSNTLLGDTPGANMEAAGINTHLYVDPLMRQGLGIMGGTRTTAVGTPANGQYVSYPVPAPLLP